MTKTDWRSEFSDKMASMITPIQQRKMNEIEDFIEQTRLDAQIEVMEELREKQKNISIDSRYNGEMTAIKRAIAVENLTQNSIKTLKQK
jgi:gluconate kinase